MNVVFSEEFHHSIIGVYQWGVETFGKVAADRYEQQLFDVVGVLDKTYLLHPDCRWLPTKSRM